MERQYKILAFTIIVFFYVSTGHAALPKTPWQAGKVILWDKTVLEGDLCYNWLMETVLFRQTDGRIRTFQANQVCQFGWFDFTLHKHRDFRTLTHYTAENPGDQAIYEICLDGSLAVVRRLRQPGGLRKRAFTHPTYYADQPALSQNTDFFDYFVYDAGRLRALDRFYSEIYTPLLTTYDKQLTQYGQIHNINDRSLLGRIILINHYNYLVEQDAKMASARRIGLSPE